LHGCLAGFDQQFAVAIAADVESQEVETVVETDNTRLGLVEGQPPRRQPLRQGVLDLLSLLSGAAQSNKIVGLCRGPDYADPDGECP
jgi:hypothetical protein